MEKNEKLYTTLMSRLVKLDELKDFFNVVWKNLEEVGYDDIVEDKGNIQRRTLMVHNLVKAIQLVRRGEHEKSEIYMARCRGVDTRVSNEEACEMLTAIELVISFYKDCARWIYRNPDSKLALKMAESGLVVRTTNLKKGENVVEVNIYLLDFLKKIQREWISLAM